MEIGYTLSSEEHPPETLVRLAARADQIGLGFATISDHYHPWTSRQGQSPFVWAVLGAIAQRTERLRVITGVTCPTLRMHPAIVAQAAATTARLFDGRFSLGVGSGENLNEHVCGAAWPEPATRIEMLEEAIGVIRELFEGDTVSHRGRYFTVDEARLFTRPDDPPQILVAASGPMSARLAACKGDGLIGLAPDRSMLELFDNEGGARKPKYAQLHFCYGPSEAECRKTLLEYWPNAALEGNLFTEVKTTELFDSAVKLVREQDLQQIPCGPDVEGILQAIRKYEEAGYDHLSLHQIGPDQESFLDLCARELLRH
jgi:coenzyme F420-dependent glucose-6-phosphate dehydrogenase